MPNNTIYSKYLHEIKSQPSLITFDEFSGTTPIFPESLKNLIQAPQTICEARKLPEFYSILSLIKDLSGTENAFLTPGASQAFFTILMHLERKINSVAIEIPFYEPYHSLLKRFKIKPFPIEVKQNNKLNLNNLKKLSKVTKCLIISNPNFFTGVELTTGEIETLCRVFEVVIIDEVHLPMFSLDNLFSAQCKAKNLIRINSLSKSLGLSSIRLGWASSSKILKDFEKETYFTHVDMPAHSILVGLKALENKNKILSEIKTNANNNRESVRNYLLQNDFILSHNMESGHFIAYKTQRKSDFSLGLDSKLFGLKGWRRLRYDLDKSKLNNFINCGLK